MAEVLQYTAGHSTAFVSNAGDGVGVGNRAPGKSELPGLGLQENAPAIWRTDLPVLFASVDSGEFSGSGAVLRGKSLAE